MGGSVCVGVFFAFGVPSEYSTYIGVCLPVMRQAASDTASCADKRNTQTHPNSAAGSVPLHVGFSCQFQLVSLMMIHIIHNILG